MPADKTHGESENKTKIPGKKNSFVPFSCAIEMNYKMWFSFSCPGSKPFHYGPGDNALLKSLLTTKNLTQTCQELKISYKKAWTKLKQIEKGIGTPVIITHRGGAGGGGSIEVTEWGRLLIKHFDEIHEHLEKIRRETNQMLKNLGAQ